MFPRHRRDVRALGNGQTLGRTRFLIGLVLGPLVLFIGTNGIASGSASFCSPGVSGVVAMSGLLPSAIAWTIWLSLAAGGLPGECWHRIGPAILAVPALFVGVHGVGHAVVHLVYRDDPNGLHTLCGAWSVAYRCVAEAGGWCAVLFAVGVAVLERSGRNLCSAAAPAPSL